MFEPDPPTTICPHCSARFSVPGFLPHILELHPGTPLALAAMAILEEESERLTRELGFDPR